MQKRSKRYRALEAEVEKAGGTLKPRQPSEAAQIIKKLSNAKFAESVRLAVHLNLDSKKADQQFRGSFSMPNGTGRAVRVIVFVDDGDKVNAALAGGAVKAGGEDVVNEVLGGFMDFDVAIATPKMMRHVGKLGKVLGPRGLMPSPKSGTVTDDVASAVREFKGGKIEYRADKDGNVHVRVGIASFEADKLAENVTAFLNHVADHRPSSVKGQFIKNISLSPAMGPGVTVAYAEKE